MFNLYKKMNKLKENTTIKTIKLINKENLETKKQKINENNNLISEQIKNNNFKIQQIKNNEIDNNRKIKKKEEQKYFEFHAHFKYNELVDALNKLKSSKNESTSNTSNANINNNNKINDKNDLNSNNQKIILNNIEIHKNNNNKRLNKSKPRNHKGVSRNIQMNNYIKYLGYIEECKDNNLALSSISNNIQQNKTSYLPQTDLVKKRINNHLEQLNQLKHKILIGKKTNEIKKEEKCDNIIKDSNININHQKNKNLISISLINSNNNNKNIISNCSHHTKNINKNNIQIDKKIAKKKIKNLHNKNQINNFNNKAINKINKEESINNSKIQLKANNLFLNNINTNSNGNKFIKNKKIKNNVPNFNCDLVGEKRKAHSSSISKNKKNIIHKINTNNMIINNLNNINNINNFQPSGTTNKKQNTLNHILTSTNRIKPVTTKSYQTNKINIAIDNKNSKMKIITLNYADIGKIKNKIIKKTINSFGSSLCKTKDIDKTKSKSNSKSNSKNKTSNGKLLTDKNEKYEKNKLHKYNNRINAIQKEKTYANNNTKKFNENLKIDTNKSLSKNNLSRFNNTQNKEVNIIDSQSNINNKKKGINLVFNGQFENKNGNMRINSIIYNINKNNTNLNINNSNYNLDKNNKLKGNINISGKKSNNIIKNNIIINQKINNLKNNKNKINSIVTVFNNGKNNNISSKKNEGFKKTKKIIV